MSRGLITELNEEVDRLYAVTTELSDEIDRLRALNTELIEVLEGFMLRGMPNETIWARARAALAKAKGEDPCPICGGVEGCDHTVSERARAAIAKARGEA